MRIRRFRRVHSASAGRAAEGVRRSEGKKSGAKIPRGALTSGAFAGGAFSQREVFIGGHLGLSRSTLLEGHEWARQNRVGRSCPKAAAWLVRTGAAAARVPGRRQNISADAGGGYLGARRHRVAVLSKGRPHSELPSEGRQARAPAGASALPGIHVGRAGAVHCARPQGPADRSASGHLVRPPVILMNCDNGISPKLTVQYKCVGGSRTQNRNRTGASFHLCGAVAAKSCPASWPSARASWPRRLRRRWYACRPSQPYRRHRRERRPWQCAAKQALHHANAQC